MYITFTDNKSTALVNMDDVLSIWLVKDSNQIGITYKNSISGMACYNSHGEAVYAFNRIVERLKELGQL